MTYTYIDSTTDVASGIFDELHRNSRGASTEQKSDRHDGIHGQEVPLHCCKGCLDPHTRRQHTDHQSKGLPFREFLLLHLGWEVPHTPLPLQCWRHAWQMPHMRRTATESKLPWSRVCLRNLTSLKNVRIQDNAISLSENIHYHTNLLEQSCFVRNIYLHEIIWLDFHHLLYVPCSQENENDRPTIPSKTCRVPTTGGQQWQA